MSEKTPVERAAEALDVNFNPDRYPIMAAMFRDYAATALTAAVADREGLARVLDDHQDVGGDVWYACQCGWPGNVDATRAQFTAHQADAVARWLTGEAS